MDWYQILWTVIGFIITAIVTFVGEKLVVFFSQKIKNEKLKAAVTTATEIVANTVKSLTQTVVDDAKKAGKFDKGVKETVKQNALNKAKELLSDEIKKMLSTNFGVLETWLDTTIEAQVLEQKSTN